LGKPPRVPQLPSEDAPSDPLAKDLYTSYQTVVDNVSALCVDDPFAKLQRVFLETNRSAICKSLRDCYHGVLRISPATLSPDVRSRLLNDWTGSDAMAGTLRPAFHGTARHNYEAIFQQGLLVPGTDNDVKVIHGSAHGLGIYTGTATSAGASLSKSFSECSILVCAVLDDAAASSHRFGCRHVSAESESVRHVGSAMVVFDKRRVAPLFIASRCVLAPPFDWEKHRRLLLRLAAPSSRRPLRFSRARRKHLPKAFRRKT